MTTYFVSCSQIQQPLFNSLKNLTALLNIVTAPSSNPPLHINSLCTLETNSGIRQQVCKIHVSASGETCWNIKSCHKSAVQNTKKEPAKSKPTFHDAVDQLYMSILFPTPFVVA